MAQAGTRALRASTNFSFAGWRRDYLWTGDRDKDQHAAPLRVSRLNKHSPGAQ